MSSQLIAAMRAEEIRASVKHLDSLQRLAIYLSTDNVEVRLAFEDAPLTLAHGRPGDMPVFEAFVDQERVDAVQQARAEIANPEQAQTLADLLVLARAYESVLATATTSIYEAIPSLRQVPDPALV